MAERGVPPLRNVPTLSPKSVCLILQHLFLASGDHISVLQSDLVNLLYIFIQTRFYIYIILSLPVSYLRFIYMFMGMVSCTKLNITRVLILHS